MNYEGDEERRTRTSNGERRTKQRRTTNDRMKGRVSPAKYGGRDRAEQVSARLRVCSGAMSQRASRDRQVQQEPHGIPRHTACPAGQGSRSSPWHRVHRHVGKLDLADPTAAKAAGRPIRSRPSHGHLEEDRVAQEPRDRGATYDGSKARRLESRSASPTSWRFPSGRPTPTSRPASRTLWATNWHTFKIHRVDAMNDGAGIPIDGCHGKFD